MITLKSVFATNYKAYKKIIIPIRKLNVYIGKNSAGKSSLVRLIPFIINSLNLKDGRVIDFSPFGIDLGATYSDVVHGHSDYTQMGLGALFDIDEDSVSFLTRLTYSTELKEVIASQFIGRLNGEDVIHIQLDLDSTDKNKSPIYKIDGYSKGIEFNGLIPNLSQTDFKDEEKVSRILQLLKIIKNHDFKISYLGPFRSELLRTYTTKVIKNFNIGSKGQNAPYIYQVKEEKSNGLLGNKIKEWMSTHFGGKYFAIKKYERSFSINCISKNSISNITDEGMGFAQLFPSIVDRNVRDLDKVKGIEIIEQPELHMHPAACGVVADLYISAIKNNLVFIETHSKEFVLRTRRRVAEGLDNSDIYLGYVSNENENNETTLDEILIDENGAVDNWPNGIFEEDFDEVMALHEVNSKNENNI